MEQLNCMYAAPPAFAAERYGVLRTATLDVVRMMEGPTTLAVEELFDTIYDNRHLFSAALVTEHARDAIEVVSTLSGIQPKTHNEVDLVRDCRATVCEIANRNINLLSQAADCDDDGLAVNALSIICRSAAHEDASEELRTCFAARVPQVLQRADMRSPASSDPGSRLAWEVAKRMIPRELNPPPAAQDEAENTFGPFAASLGLDAREISAAWHQGCPPKKRWFEWEVMRNLQTLIALEQRRPGLAKDIIDTFGIVNFGRCTPWMLKAMYEDHLQNPGKPYLWMMMGRNTHNRVFSRPQQLERVYKQLQQKGFGLKLYECSAKGDAYRAALRAKWRFRIHGAPVAGALVWAHGKPRSLGLGARYVVDRAITAEDLEAVTLQDIGEVLMPGAPVGFHSCSTGNERDGKACIARKVAMALGRTTMAPSEVVGSSHWRALGRGGGVVIEMRQYVKKGRTHARRSCMRTFDGAQLQRDDKGDVYQPEGYGIVRRARDLTELEPSPQAEFYA
jgi:hypothetical protein